MLPSSRGTTKKGDERGRAGATAGNFLTCLLQRCSKSRYHGRSTQEQEADADRQSSEQETTQRCPVASHCIKPRVALM
eukprot:2860953-Amphidinium_carterae.1